MKSIRNIFLLAISAIVFSFYSCSDSADYNSLNEDLQSNENFLSAEDAKLLLSDFLDSEIKTRSGEVAEFGDYKIRNYQVSTESKSENVPVYQYAVKTSNKEGYALVVADKRISKVLIYSEQGSLADTSFIEPLRLYVRTIPEYIASDLNNHYKIDSKTTTPAVTTRAQSVLTYYCFLPTIWGQQYPYNSQCPASSCGTPNMNGRYPAGCVAIAIAQILAYHKTPSSLNWTSILSRSILTANSSSTDINQVGGLIANIGSLVNMIYDCDGSGALSSSAPSAFSYYGLRTGAYRAFDIATVAYSLQNGYPVYMRGVSSAGGHAWVCDGYKKHIYSPNEYYEYLDMNWGWNGTSNGFYYIASPLSLNAGGYTFNSSFMIIPDIR